MSLSKDDRADLQNALENNLRKRKPFSNGHPIMADVAEAVEEMWARGRTEFRAREIAGDINGYGARGVGMALSMLADQGHLEKIGGQTPYRWRINR